MLAKRPKENLTSTSAYTEGSPSNHYGDFGEGGMKSARPRGKGGGESPKKEEGEYIAGSN